jgi:hypothetical protein
MKSPSGWQQLFWTFVAMYICFVITCCATFQIKKNKSIHSDFFFFCKCLAVFRISSLLYFQFHFVQNPNNRKHPNQFPSVLVHIRSKLTPLIS